MWLLFEKSKKIVFALVLSIIPLVLIYLQNKDYKVRTFLSKPIVEITGFAEGMAIKICETVSDSIFRHIAISKKYDELLKLRALSNEVEGLTAQLAYFQNELLRVTNLTNTINGPNFKNKIYAKVIATSGAPLSRTVRINKGSKEGIKVRNAVVSEQGAVGQVLNVSEHFSDVLLITDSSSAIDAKVLGSNVRGLVRGLTNNKEYLMQMRDVDALSDLQDGAIVVTSGLNSLFPSGVPIGKVQKVFSNKDDLWIWAKLVPYVSMSRVEHVNVLTGDYTYKKEEETLSQMWNAEIR